MYTHMYNPTDLLKDKRSKMKLESEIGKRTWSKNCIYSSVDKILFDVLIACKKSMRNVSIHSETEWRNIRLGKKKLHVDKFQLREKRSHGSVKK